MGLFRWLRGKDERAMPPPGSPEFEAMVNGSALPGSSVEMGRPGWSSVTGASSADAALTASEGGAAGGAGSQPHVVTGPAGAIAIARQLAEMFGGSAALGQGGTPSIDLRHSQNTAMREEIMEAMRRHGIDPKPGTEQRVDTSAVPGLTREVMEILARHGLGRGG